MTQADTPRAAYVHVPFCRHRCEYCNFTVVAGRRDLEADYLLAIELELQALGRPQPVDTLFVGGGTPTELSPRGLERFSRLLDEWFPRGAEHETTFEANPDSLDAERVAILQQHHVNRLSLGVQSFDESKLRWLDRFHTVEQISLALKMAREAFASVSLDLIFAAVGESLEIWLADLAAAVAFQPDHLSTYGLTIERGTVFWNQRHRGELVEVDETLQSHMYLAGVDVLHRAGYEHYEISNFAQPGARCRHNQTYWTGESYFGAGPGAARYVNGVRETNHRSTTTYLRRVLAGLSPVAEREVVDAEARAREKLVFGLRMRDGVAIDSFAHLTGYSIDELAGRQVAAGLDRGLLENAAGQLRLTRAGLLLCDSIVGQML